MLQLSETSQTVNIIVTSARLDNNCGSLSAPSDNNCMSLSAGQAGSRHKDPAVMKSDCRMTETDMKNLTASTDKPAFNNLFWVNICTLGLILYL